MNETNGLSDTLRNWITGVIVVLALLGLYFAGNILVPFILAAVIAYVLDPVVDWVQRRGHMSRHAGIIVVMVGLAVVVAGVMALAIPEMVSQVRHFTERLPGYVAAVRAQVQPILSYMEEHYPGYAEGLRERALEGAGTIAPTVGGWVATGLIGIFTSIARVLVWVLTIIIIPVFAYYLLLDYADLRDALMALLPIRMRPNLRRRAVEIDRVLRAWVKGQFTVALALAVIYSIGLTLLGVPLGLLIGIVGGLANMVPYLGLVVGFLPAALLALLDTGSWLTPLLVAAVFLFGQMLEGTVISPRVMGSGLGLPPALILLAVMVGGELFGFTGLLLAVPATAAAFVLLKDLRREHDQAALEAAPHHVETRRLLRRRRPR
jgi:predicted PurR-regulated permease PerM